VEVKGQTDGLDQLHYLPQLRGREWISSQTAKTGLFRSYFVSFKNKAVVSYRLHPGAVETCKYDFVDKTGSIKRIATPPPENRAMGIGTCTYMVNIGHVILEIDSWTDRQTNTQTRLSEIQNTAPPQSELSNYRGDRHTILVDRLLYLDHSVGLPRDRCVLPETISWFVH